MKYLLILMSVNLFVFSAAAADVTIVQKDKKFDKPELTIKKGDTVKFQNSETNVTHNVYSLGPKNAFDLQSQAPGAISPITFNEVGETEIECAIHPTMKLKIKVVE